MCASARFRLRRTNSDAANPLTGVHRNLSRQGKNIALTRWFKTPASPFRKSVLLSLIQQRIAGVLRRMESPERNSLKVQHHVLLPQTLVPPDRRCGAYFFAATQEFLPAWRLVSMAPTSSILSAARSTLRRGARRSTYFDFRKTMKKRRPVFFNLTQLQLPVGALTSISHRITGILLALGTPFGIYLLALSLQGPQGYARVTDMFDKWAFKGLVILFVWALAHHLLAGLRHLLSDIDIGSHLHAARASAWIINCSAVAIALLTAGALL